MAVDTLAAQQSQQLIHKSEVVYGNGQFDVAAVAWAAEERRQPACCASSALSVVISSCIQSTIEAYELSRNAPKAASCKPPATGCSKVSKVVGFVMRFTESDLMSLAARKPNSTAWTADEVGW